MELERRRGITIRSAVVSFELGDLTVNLIDTPGHSDFIAEVERALSVLDGAVLVISAVEGVQVQTRLLMRTLSRLRIPTVLFVNKIDRMGARYESLLADIGRLLTPSAVPMGAVRDLGTRVAQYEPFPLVHQGLGEVLAERNDGFLAGYLDDALGEADYREELSAQVRRSQVHPVYFGSAMTGVGVPELIDGCRVQPVGRGIPCRLRFSRSNAVRRGRRSHRRGSSAGNCGRARSSRCTAARRRTRRSRPRCGCSNAEPRLRSRPPSPAGSSRCEG
jgi:ribosomal protection tetracycline resistance protein